MKNKYSTAVITAVEQIIVRLSDFYRTPIKDYWQQHFDAGQVTEVKNALNLFGDDKQSQQAAGDFLYFTAKQKEDFDSREQLKARREVDNVVLGHYDSVFSMKR